MALFVMILRKMIKNKWLELSLLFGLILSVALASSMPIYTNAILKRLLVQELQSIQTFNGMYPGTYWVAANAPQPEKANPSSEQEAGVIIGGEAPKEVRTAGELFSETDEYIENTAAERFGVPVLASVIERATFRFNMQPLEPDKVDTSKQRSADLTAIKGMKENENFVLLDGRLPSKEPVDGVYEALVVKEALTELNMVLGNVFVVSDDRTTEPIHVKPVGVFDRTDYADLFWYNIPSTYKSSFIIDYELFERDFTKAAKVPVKVSYWYLALDYNQMSLTGANDFVNTDYRLTLHLDERYEDHNKNAPALNTLALYRWKEANLRVMLWSLNVPVLLMLGFYLYMVANLITDRQKTEIAVLRSRGASRFQIIMSYVIEGAVLGAIAFVTGPYLGVLITKVLGASSGFLEFVQRAKLEAGVNAEAFQYALVAIVSSVVMTLIPVFLATRVSIVGHKQQSARLTKLSFWHKYYIDIILIGVSIYGLMNYKSRMNDLLTLGLSSSDLRVDPLLFLIPALFILGSGLLLLRLYPWFMKLVYWTGRRWWPPSIYSTLIQVSRSTTQYQFIMVFLIITIATGLFSASATRTINKNTFDKIEYNIGTDIVMQIKWANDAPPVLLLSSMSADELASATASRVQYTEPPFETFAELPGVEHAAKVFNKENIDFTRGRTRDKVELMAIETNEFGPAAYMRNNLMDYHFYQYLNLIANNPSAVLVSRSIADEHKLQPGDQFNISWSGVESMPVTIYGIIDYWPTWNPNPGSVSVQQPGNNNNGPVKPKLVVGNLSYIQNNMALEPYQVWLKLEEDAMSQPIYDGVTAAGYEIQWHKNAKQERTNALREPFQLAINGVMTLGFIISIVICFFGFLLYWILSLHARTLQFGILRAMGISFGQLILILVGEQILVSGAAILIGIFTGNATSYLFVPLFELSFDPKTQVPPFEVTFDPTDQQRLYWIVTSMITIGLGILAYIVSRIKIHQAVKLGED